jgi:hypothetical protein
MTNHFASFFLARIVPVFVVVAVVLPDASAEPPFVRPDLVVRHKSRQKGEGIYETGNPKPLVIRRRRNRAKVNLDIELNGDPLATAARRDVRVSIVGPRKNRLGSYQYTFGGANITGLIATGAFSGYVDPGLNFKGLAVEVSPRKKSGRRKKRNFGVTIRAFDSDTGRVADGVRVKLRKR